MKRYFLITLCGFGVVLSGCSKFLDKQPISSLTEENFYKNTEEVEAGVFGCYAALRPVYNNDYILAGLRSDDAYISDAEGDMNQIDGFSENTTNSFLANYWQDSYYAIKQCNTVLKYLNNVPDTTLRNYYEGEAKFIRSLIYFNMVRLWGKVPLVTSSVGYNDASSYARVDTAIVYDQIINDFSTAIAKLPDTWPSIYKARASSFAAKGMLAKVFMTQRRYTEARVLLTDLLQNSGRYRLLPDYRSVFGVDDEMNDEVMFAVRYKSASNGLGNTFTYNMDNVSGSVGFRAASDFRGNTPFPNADSIRKNQTFLQYRSTTGSISFYCGGKYQDPGAPRNDGGSDFIILRYADIILLYAEVVNEMDGDTPLTLADASDPTSRLFQLNRIRTRASGGVPAAVPVYAFNGSAVNTKDNFRRTLKAERRRELGMEDQRWYDLLRWGDAITVMNAHFASRSIVKVVEDFQVLYPIPQREIDVSGQVVTQNPGY